MYKDTYFSEVLLYENKELSARSPRCLLSRITELEQLFVLHRFILIHCSPLLLLFLFCTIISRPLPLMIVTEINKSGFFHCNYIILHTVPDPSKITPKTNNCKQTLAPSNIDTALTKPLTWRNTLLNSFITFYSPYIMFS